MKPTGTSKVSENFWKEMQARGFNIKNENGGRNLPEHRFSWVERSPEGYRLKNFHHKERIVFISGEVFIKTVEKIENMLKYKLAKYSLEGLFQGFEDLTT